MLLGAEADQKIPPCNIPLWQKDYFELKAIENEQIQEEISTLPLSAPKAGHKFPFEEGICFMYQEEKSNFYHLRQEFDSFTAS